jgi:LAS seventeen-binding protein 5
VRPPTPESEPASPVQRTFPQNDPRRRSLQPHKRTKSKDQKSKRLPPVNLDKERPAILETIAAAQQASTNLTNALKHLNRESQHPTQDTQIQTLYRQCRSLRKDVLIYIQRIESEEWIGTLINANDELVQSLAGYEKALKTAEEDSDSDVWKASDSDEEKKTQRKKSNAVADDLARRLRSTSLKEGESPPPRPPRPRAASATVVSELPPPKPPRPTVASARYPLY